MTGKDLSLLLPPFGETRYVRRASACEQRSNGLGMRPVQWDHLSSIELDHTPKAYLFGGVPDDLRESGGGNYDSVPVVESRLEN